MSQQQGLTYGQRIKEAANIIRGRSAKIADVYEKAGIKVHVGQNHAIRTELVVRKLPYIKDSRADINDRVQAMDDLIISAGMMFSPMASDAVWAEAFTTWQDLMGDWALFNSQRRIYKEAVMVEVSELEQVPIQVVNADGSTSVDIEEVWSSPKAVKPETYFARVLLDKEMGLKNKDNSDRSTYRFLGAKADKATSDPSWHTDADPAFEGGVEEEAALAMGEREMLPTGWVVLGYSIHTWDVLSQSTDVFHLTMPTNPQGQAIVPASSIQRPGGGGAPQVQTT